MGQLGLQVIVYIFLDTFSCIICDMCSYISLLCHKNNKEMVSAFRKSAFVDIFWRRMQNSHGSLIYT